MTKNKNKCGLELKVFVDEDVEEQKGKEEFLTLKITKFILVGVVRVEVEYF